MTTLTAVFLIVADSVLRIMPMSSVTLPIHAATTVYRAPRTVSRYVGESVVFYGRMITPGTQHIAGASLSITYPGALLEFVDVAPDPVSPMTVEITGTGAQSGGMQSVLLRLNADTPLNTGASLFTMTFRCRTEGKATLDIVGKWTDAAT